MDCMIPPEMLHQTAQIRAAELRRYAARPRQPHPIERTRSAHRNGTGRIAELRRTVGRALIRCGVFVASVEERPSCAS